MTKDSIIIRNFELTDSKSLASLTNELGYPTTVEEMEARMKIINRLENHWTVIAVVDGNVVGYMGLNKHYFWEQNGHFLRVQALVIKKEFRRLSIGKKLIEHAEQLGKKIAAKLIILNCGNKPERESAHLFYPKMGFAPTSTGYVKHLD